MHPISPHSALPQAERAKPFAPREKDGESEARGPQAGGARFPHALNKHNQAKVFSYAAASSKVCSSLASASFMRKSHAP